MGLGAAVLERIQPSREKKRMNNMPKRTDRAQNPKIKKANGRTYRTVSGKEMMLLDDVPETIREGEKKWNAWVVGFASRKNHTPADAGQS